MTHKNMESQQPQPQPQEQNKKNQCCLIKTDKKKIVIIALAVIAGISLGINIFFLKHAGKNRRFEGKYENKREKRGDRFDEKRRGVVELETSSQAPSQPQVMPVTQ